MTFAWAVPCVYGDELGRSAHSLECPSLELVNFVGPWLPCYNLRCQGYSFSACLNGHTHAGGNIASAVAFHLVHA